eukprot:10550728-Alexandrium_andersonii.AAC.1
MPQERHQTRSHCCDPEVITGVGPHASRRAPAVVDPGQTTRVRRALSALRHAIAEVVIQADHLRLW